MALPDIRVTPREVVWEGMGPHAWPLLALVSGGIHFLGDQACPDRSSAEEQLRRIDPGALQGKPRHFALLEPQAGGLGVRLFDEQGNQLEQRILDGTKSCSDWARIAAALLATWETDLAAPDQTFADEAPRPRPEEHRLPPAVQLQVVPVAPGRRLQLELGVGAGAASAGASEVAGGGTLLVALGPERRPFGVRLTLEGTTLRGQTVGGGAASWQRTGLSIGGFDAFGNGPWKVELGGALLAGILTARGSGFEVSQSASSLEPGLEICPRLRWDFAREWMAWAQFGGALWFKTETVQVLSGSQAISSAAIPTFDASVTLGLSLLVDL
jgi:hypothetical protein